jgi:hypothetical protein
MTTLATLLLARELRIKRLNQLAKRYGAPKGTLLDGKIVAYLQNNHVKRAFGLHAADSDMLPGPAAASILRAELAERWLERVIGT